MAHVNKRGQPKDRFVKCAAEYFGLEGELAEPEAVKYFYKIHADISRDIEGLPLDDGEKKYLNSYLSPFNGLRSFAHVHMDVQTAKNNFLKDSNLVGLINIHMAISGHKRRPELDLETIELASLADELAEAVRNSSLPDHLKETLAYRLLQISTSLKHFLFFGSDKLEVELATLLGELAINRDVAEESENQEIFGRTFEFFGRCAEGLSKADKTYSVAQSLLEKGQQIFSLLT